MPQPGHSKESPTDDLVPFPRIIAMVRQLTHDVRNGLNNADLQSALLQELVSDPQVKPEIKRLRATISDTAKMLQEFSRRFWVGEPQLVTYSAQAFFEDFRTRIEKSLPQMPEHLQWRTNLGEEMIAVDIEMMFRGLGEYFKNAIQMREDGQIDATVTNEDGCLVVQLEEPKKSGPLHIESWGLEPLVSGRRGGIGMGLYFARQVIVGHGGKVAQRFDSARGKLTTRVTLPLAPN